MKRLEANDSPTRRIANVRVPHGVTPSLVISVYPGGQIGLRELGRRDEYKLDAGTLYVQVMLNSSRKIQALAKKIRKEQGIGLAAARKKAKEQVLNGH